MSFQVDNCCNCQEVSCAACSGNALTSTKFLGTFAPTGASYQESSFQDGGAGRYFLVYCGGSFGFAFMYSTQDVNGNAVSTFALTWGTLVFSGGPPVPWNDPHWIPGHTIALAYGQSGFFVDGFFGNCPIIGGGGIPANLNQQWLTTGPGPQPVSGIAGVSNPAAIFPAGPIGDLADTKADGIAESIINLATAGSGIFTGTTGGNGSMQGEFGCVFYEFYSDGTSPVKMQFTAPLYSGNSWPPPPPGDPPGPTFMIKTPPDGQVPTFALLKINPSFSAKGSCALLNGNVGSGQYILRLILSNDTDFAWTGNCSFSGPVTVSPANQGQAFSCNPRQRFGLDFAITVANPFGGGKDFTGTLTLTQTINGLAIPMAILTYDCTPTITGITAVSNGVSFVDPNRNRITIAWTGSNGICLDDIGLLISGSQISGLFDPQNGTALSNPIDMGVPNDCSLAAFDFTFDILPTTPHAATVSFLVQWLDDGRTSSVPDSTFTIPLLWT